MVYARVKTGHSENIAMAFASQTVGEATHRSELADRMALIHAEIDKLSIVDCVPGDDAKNERQTLDLDRVLLPSDQRSSRKAVFVSFRQSAANDLDVLLKHFGQTSQRLPVVMMFEFDDFCIVTNALHAYFVQFAKWTDCLTQRSRNADRFRRSCERGEWRNTAANRISDLTARQRQVMTRVLAGQPSKIIAADLHISQRTVENDQAQIMKKTGAKSLPALTQLAMIAALDDADEAGMKFGDFDDCSDERLGSKSIVD